MAKTTKKRVISAIQIVLLLLVIAGIVWIAFKVVSYNQAQKVYQDIERAYAAEATEADVSSVNFTDLQELHPGVFAWLKMDDVDISYPIMHGTDNEHYLYYGPDEEPNIDGSIFMDYRNKSFDDLHVLLYGHNMLDESMFGQLDEYMSEEFYRKGTGAFTIFTPEKAYRYKIFAVNVVDETDDVYQTGYQNTTVFGGFANQLKENSMYDTGVTVTGTDHVVTLSTCSIYDRMILSAKRL